RGKAEAGRARARPYGARESACRAWPRPGTPEAVRRRERRVPTRPRQPRSAAVTSCEVTSHSREGQAEAKAAPGPVRHARQQAVDGPALGIPLASLASVPLRAEL